MTAQRGLLLIILGLLTFLLFQSWDREQASKPQVQSQASIDTSKGLDRLIDLNNSVVDLKINLYGGDFVSAVLKDYFIDLDNKDPVPLLSTDTSNYFTIMTGLTGANGVDTSTSRPEYILVSNVETALGNVLTLKSDTDLLNIEKIITLYKDSYKVDVTYKVTNKFTHNVSLNSFGTLKRRTPTKKSTGFISQGGFSGAVLSTTSDNYEKYSFDEIKDGDLKPVGTTSGWAAIVNHFFLSAIIPHNDNQPFNISSSYSNDFNYVNLTGHNVVIEPNQTKELSDTLWIGPKLQNQLSEVAPHLDLTVDYGWAWFISKPLFKTLSWIQSLVYDWGLTIILLTIIVRGVLFPLSRIQFRTQAKMRKVGPEMKLINERYEGDRIKKAQEMQKLYKKHKINVLSGCFPVIIQMPIFLSLFYVFNEAIELRHTSWLWIKDLSGTDPLFILPLLNGLSLVLMMRMTPMPDTMDPLQKKLMTYMPYAFALFMFLLPSGLVLYYTISNVLTIIMMKYIFWTVEKEYKSGRSFK